MIKTKANIVYLISNDS